MQDVTLNIATPLVPAFDTSHGRGNSAWSWSQETLEEVNTDYMMTSVWDELLDARELASADQHLNRYLFNILKSSTLFVE